MLACIRKIIRREGFGDILAEGINRVARWVGKGSEEFAMEVKGLDPGQHEPRLMPSMGLGFMVNPHGADHCLNVHDILFVSKDRFESWSKLGFHDPVAGDDIGPRKVALFRIEHLRQGLLDCLAMCHLSSVMVDLSVIVEILDAVTGWGTGVMEILRIEERVMTVARLKTSGVLSERCLDRDEMERAKRYYYTLMGWDKKGVPLPERVEELYIE
jgi:aldehyde:ferredoxin oxidoreductase